MTRVATKAKRFWGRAALRELCDSPEDPDESASLAQHHRGWSALSGTYYSRRWALRQLLVRYCVKPSDRRPVLVPERRTRFVEDVKLSDRGRPCRTSAWCPSKSRLRVRARGPVLSAHGPQELFTSLPYVRRICDVETLFRYIWE